jgi:hypothetical protein
MKNNPFLLAFLKFDGSNIIINTNHIVSAHGIYEPNIKDFCAVLRMVNGDEIPTAHIYGDVQAAINPSLELQNRMNSNPERYKGK